MQKVNGIKSQIKDEVFNLIGKDNYKKKNLIKALRNKFPDIKSGVICRILKKYSIFKGTGDRPNLQN